MPERESSGAKQTKIPEGKVQLLLERVVTIYEKSLCEKTEARNYLETRGIMDAGLFTKYRIGYCTGSIGKILPREGPVREELREIGILTNNDSERFAGCIVFPVYDVEGRLTRLCGCSIQEGTRLHISLPNRHSGLWNISVIKTCSDIIVVQSVLDGLSIEMAGSSNVIAMQGQNMLPENDIQLFKDFGVQRLILMLNGSRAAMKVQERLEGINSGPSFEERGLPDGHDPNSYLTKYGAQKLAELIETVNGGTDSEGPPLPGENCGEVRDQSEGFVVSFGSRRYQVLGLEKGTRRLKATVRVMAGGRLHVDTLDLYSSRARRGLAQDLCRISADTPETIEADINRLLVECERAVAERARTKPSNQKAAEYVMSDAEHVEAQEFGKSPDLIARILADFETCGLVGEEANKLLGYLAMTSKKRKEPLSILILSSSGAGKTALQDAIVSFCPPEDLVKLTSLSGKALFYKEQQSLKHKVLVIEEGAGAAEASYAIRSLISSGVLIRESTTRDLATGRLTTMENRVEGPTVVFCTTTNPATDPETRSRFFVTSIDESREQTQRILAFQRQKHMQHKENENMRTESVLRLHHNFQRLLQPLAVRNPFAEQLTYGDERMQGRRDQPKYLELIKTIAFLRQMQKEIMYEQNTGRPYIEVDLEDIQLANWVTHEILGKCLGELSAPGRELLMHLDEMVEDRVKEVLEKNGNGKVQSTSISFTRRDIRESAGWSNARVHRYLKELVELEYVLVASGRNGTRYRYRLAYEGQGKDGSKFVLGLKPVEELNSTG